MGNDWDIGTGPSDDLVCERYETFERQTQRRDWVQEHVGDDTVVPQELRGPPRPGGTSGYEAEHPAPPKPKGTA